MSTLLRRAGARVAVRAMLAAIAALVMVAAGAPAAAAEPGAGSVGGTVTTAAGEPAAWIFVELYDADGGYVGGTSSDGGGRYVFERVPAGEYTLVFVQEQLRQWSPGRTTPDTAKRYTVADGAALVVDEQLLAAGAVEGVVRDAGGAPAAGVSVQALDDSGGGPNTTTDEEGRYRLAAYPGAYRIGLTLPENHYAVQYAPGTLTRDEGRVYEVAAGAAVALDVTLLPTGSLSGRFTDVAGEPLPGTYVSIDGVGHGGTAWESTGDDGEFRVARLFAGDYRVKFTGNGFTWDQWAYGRTSERTANVITVAPDAETRVEDRQLAKGTVRVRAVDDRSGAAITAFCARLGDEVCTTTGEVVLADVAQGTHRVEVSTADRLFRHTEVTVEVTGAAPVTVTARLAPAGAITTTVVDRASGEPVANACVSAQAAGSGRLPEHMPWCSDSAGRVTVGPLEPGRYNLFVAAPSEGRTDLGAQWVGRTGGTGDAAAARVITARAGEVTTAPAARLDRAGSVSGIVTSAETGEPVPDTYVSLAVWGMAGPANGVDTDAAGRYTLGGLGPYAWPLFLHHDSYARQWSGGVADRLLAKRATVTPGATATFDVALHRGTELTGTVKDEAGTPVADSYVFAHDARFDAIMGWAWAQDGTYRMLVMGPQVVELRYRAGDAEGRHPRRVLVPAGGSRTVDVTVRAG